MAEELVRVKVVVELDIPKYVHEAILKPQNRVDEETQGIFVNQVAVAIWKTVYSVKEVHTVGYRRLTLLLSRNMRPCINMACTKSLTARCRDALLT